MSEASIAPLPAGMSPAVLPDRRRSDEQPGREHDTHADSDGEGHAPPRPGAAAPSPAEPEESPVDAATLFATTLLATTLGAADNPLPARPADEWEPPPTETRITDRRV